MSTTEKEKPAEEPKIDEKTGLVEGLDPGQSYETHSPEERSDPIPVPHGQRLVGQTAAEAAVTLAKEKVAAAEAEAENAEPTTPDEKLAAAKEELAAAEKSAAEEQKAEEATTSTTKTTSTSKT